MGLYMPMWVLYRIKNANSFYLIVSHNFVSIEINPFSKSFIADVASKWLDSLMNRVDVFRQTFLLYEFRATKFTFQRFHLRFRFFVNFSNVSNHRVLFIVTKFTILKNRFVNRSVFWQRFFNIEVFQVTSIEQDYKEDNAGRKFLIGKNVSKRISVPVLWGFKQSDCVWLVSQHVIE